MSRGINKAFVAGHLGQDPEIRYTANGTAVVNFTVATKEKYKDEERTEWHRLVAWGKTGELVSQYLKKGDLAGFDGKLQTRKWEAQDGSDRYSTEIIVREIHFLSSKGQDSGQRPAQQPAQQPQQDDGFDDIPF